MDKIIPQQYTFTCKLQCNLNQYTLNVSNLQCKHKKEKKVHTHIYRTDEHQVCKYFQT